MTPSTAGDKDKVDDQGVEGDVKRNRERMNTEDDESSKSSKSSEEYTDDDEEASDSSDQRQQTNGIEVANRRNVLDVEVDRTTRDGMNECSFDLRNLLAINSHQVSIKELYDFDTNMGTASDGLCTISLPSVPIKVNEDHLLQKANEGMTQLLSALWKLPTERSDVGPIASLPTFFEIKIPRELPPPPPKKETKWEKFAKERGIGANNEKRSRKVWDEATGTWLYRHGYQKANAGDSQWPIMEVRKNDDPYEDPWERERDAKRSRVDKNLVNRMKNEERAGTLSKGAANRAFKEKKAIREKGREGGKEKIPSGLPIDLATGKKSGNIKPINRGKELTKAALLATQRSTASLGKFDAMRDGEPERLKSNRSAKKRKFESATDNSVVRTEAERGVKVLNSVISGGGRAKELEVRKGKHARGETAFDYDFDDGLGASSYRKKKGRAGAGKMKKITKKASNLKHS